MNFSYVRHALNSAWRFARFDSAAINDFDQSFEGFFRSFFAMILCAPFYAVIVLGERSVSANINEFLPDLTVTPLPPLDAATFFIEGFAYAVNWLAFPLAMIGIAKLLGVSHRYVPYIVAYNWGACLVRGLTALPNFLYLTGILPLQAVLFLYYPCMVLILVYRWRMARDGLQIGSINAAGVVLFDILFSVGIATLLSQLHGSVTGA